MRTTELAFGIKSKPITNDRNGYPANMGEFIYGFETMDELREYARENELEIHEATWRDGWTFCNSWMYDEGGFTHFDVAADFSDDEGWASRDELVAYRQELGHNVGDLDDLIERMTDGDIANVVHGYIEGNFGIVASDHVWMEFSIDTKNYAIGVVIV